MTAVSKMRARLAAFDQMVNTSGRRVLSHAARA